MSSIQMVVIFVEGDDVSIMFPVEDDGYADVSACRLALRFHMIPESIYINQNIYDRASGVVSHTIGQTPTSTSTGRTWRLVLRKFTAYRLKVFVQVDSKDLRHLQPPSSSLLMATILKNVKVERTDVGITILSDDSDMEPLPSEKDGQQSSHIFRRASSGNADYAPSPIQLDTSSSSMLEFLRALRALKGSRNALSRLDYDSIPAYAMQTLPPKFNGDVIFELPPVSTSHMSTYAKGMSGMDKRHNGHVWSKTVITNITNSEGFTFKTSYCLGHLHCTNTSCNFLRRSHCLEAVNEMEWEGVSPSIMDMGDVHLRGSTLVCTICKHPPSCIATCPAKVYYVLGKQSSTHAFVHLGTHSHPVKDGELRDMRERTRSLIGEQMERTPSATNSSIVMEATKELLGEFLLRPDGDSSRVMDFSDLVPVLDKCKYITSPNIRNEVSSFKHLRKFGIIDSITKLRGASKWAFVQESKFPG